MMIANLNSTSLLKLGAGVAMAVLAGQTAVMATPNSIPFLGQNRFENVIVHADSIQPQVCPAHLQNQISNTNLFTVPEQAKLAVIRTKYLNVSTNSLPAGAVFKGWEKRMFVFSGPNEKWQRTKQTNVFDIASLTYSGSRATEEITASAPGQIVSRYRDEAENGYDVVFLNNQLFKYIEYRKGQMDGLCVTFFTDFNGNKGQLKAGGEVFRWARFSQGKIVGKFLGWDSSGQLTSHVEFTEPFDFLAHSKDKFDLSWETIPNVLPGNEPEVKINK